MNAFKAYVNSANEYFVMRFEVLIAVVIKITGYDTVSFGRQPPTFWRTKHGNIAEESSVLLTVYRVCSLSIDNSCCYYVKCSILYKGEG
jgi:hypothetical protein